MKLQHLTIAFVMAMWFAIGVPSFVFAQEEKADVAAEQQQAGPSKLGPSGTGDGGTQYTDSVPDNARIAAIHLRSSRYVDAFRVTYELPNGVIIEGAWRGRSEGGQQQTLILDRGDWVTTVKGRFGSWLDSIVYETKKGKRLAGGGSGGSAGFEYNATDGTEIIGFWGNYGTLVHAVGVLLQPLPVTTVSSASFGRLEVAADSLVSSFGANLANRNEAATTTPLPTSLAGTSVKIIDSKGIERPAPLLAVSPNQVNYFIPPQVSLGSAQVLISNAAGNVLVGAARIVETRPGLFSANADGQGIAAAYLVRASNPQRIEPLSRFDSNLNRFVPIPIDIGSGADALFLILHGTGIRRGRSVSAKIGDVGAEVTYAGAQGNYAGLDQINVRLPLNVNWAGKGEVGLSLSVDGKLSNAVSAFFK